MTLISFIFLFHPLIIIEFVRFEIQYSRFNVSPSLSLFHVLFSFKIEMGRYRVAYDLIVRLNHGYGILLRPSFCYGSRIQSVMFFLGD